MHPHAPVPPIKQTIVSCGAGNYCKGLGCLPLSTFNLSSSESKVTMNLHTTFPAMGALFLLSGVAAGNLFLPSPGNNGGTDFVPKTDVTLSLSAAKTIFAADEPVLIKVTLKNNLPNGTAKILDWVLPCDKFNSEGEEVAADEGAAPLQMSHFDIRTSGNRVAAYEGAVVNRRPPGEGGLQDARGGRGIRLHRRPGKLLQV